MDIDNFLKDLGFEDPNTGEKLDSLEKLTETERINAYQLAEQYQVAQITPDKLKEHFKKCKNAVEDALIELVYCQENKENWSKIKFMLARLANYKGSEIFFDDSEANIKKIEALAKKRS